MRTHTQSRSFGRLHRPGPNLMPLVDVVVVLLVFLMLTGGFAGFATTERAVALGQSHGATRSSADTGPRLDIFVHPIAFGRADGVADFRTRLAGGEWGRDWECDSTSADALAGRLAELRRACAAHGTAPSAVQVFVHPGTGVRWGPVAEACTAARQAGFGRVSLVRVADPNRPAAEADVRGR